MNEIKCPNCGKVFQIDESDYESIVRQIRNSEFEKELNSREVQFNKDKENAVKLVEAHLKEELSNSLNKKDLEIADLKSKLDLAKSKSELEVQKAIADADKKISELEIKSKEAKESYENKLKDKDEQIAYYKDFKARQSTKMIGESLEQHCNTEFNRLRPLFPNAYFEKDNDAKTGSKGDFIFRDYDEDGNEIVSIMFEMKNEADETSTKHKNEDFLKELDKDRKEKDCEYAVLVSLLEMDNEYYNDGIVDVSHLYPKMYVIRPQFFIPLITLIRNLANKSLEYRKELELVRNQNIDITHFEENINAFKEGFSKNFNSAKKNFDSAIEEIDKAIKRLEAVKAALTTSENQLRLANSKAEDLTITKLTRNNPTMKEMFDSLKDGE
jgi:hypothetical protein